MSLPGPRPAAPTSSRAPNRVPSRAPRARAIEPPGAVRLASALALACAALAPFAPVEGVGAADDEPLLTWDRRHPLLPDDGVPLVRVYADGRVVVTRPVGYEDAGTLEYDVGPDAVARLEALARAALGGAPGSALGAAIGGSVPDAPAGELVSDETVLPDGTRVVSGVSDPTLAVFEYRPAGAEPPAAPRSASRSALGGASRTALGGALGRAAVTGPATVPDGAGGGTVAAYVDAPEGLDPAVDALQAGVQALFDVARERGR